MAASAVALVKKQLVTEYEPTLLLIRAAAAVIDMIKVEYPILQFLLRIGLQTSTYARAARAIRADIFG